MKVTRSMNAFTIWSQIERRKISRESPDLDDAEVSDLLQKRWKMINDKERPYFKETEMRELLQMLLMSQHSIDDESLRQPYFKETEMRELLQMLLMPQHSIDDESQGQPQIEEAEMHGILQMFFVSQYSIDDEMLRQPQIEESEMDGILGIFLVSQYSIDDERLRQPYVEETEMHEMLRMFQLGLQVVALVDCELNQIPKNQLEHQLVRRFSSHTKNKSIKQNKRAKSEDQDKPFSNELHELCDFVKKTCLPKGKIFKKFTYDLILRIHSFPY